LLDDISVFDPAKFLARLEIWLQRYSDRPELALVAGRCAMKARLWGKSEEFFRAAGEAGSIPAWAELARLKQAQGDSNAVRTCLAEQLKLATRQLPVLPLPRRPG
jgi:HemY protein